MNTGEPLEPEGSDLSLPKPPWQQPVIEYLNLALSENDGGATFDGVGGSS
jgi:hypothetical protein